MHYYKFNIGDYASHTQHLDITEDMAYRRMLDWLYLHESPLPDNIDQIARLIRMRTHSECIAVVLQEFFELGDYGWFQSKAMKEIDQYKAKSDKAKESAAARWNKRDANALQAECDGNANHKPLTTKQETIKDTTEKPAAVRVPYQKILDEYHSALPELPKVDLYTPKRKAKVKTVYMYDEKHRAPDYYQRYFDYIRESLFLMGKTEKPFKCDFEWLMNINNMAKVIEGKYHGN